MMETAILLAQMLTVGLMAGWLTLGLRDNILHPVVNETFTAEVVSLARMRRDWPEMHARLAHRAVHHRGVQRLLFTAIVLGEAVVVLLLWSGALCLALAAAGWMDVAAARPVALAAVAAFTALWGSFLIAGNHFGYWLCHEGAQTTHFHLLLWGMGGLVLLAIN